ncbi:unnamed protein product [Brassicogethes aeneus]|uniref:Biogenesis of lysosome-related organelles complex 1 subunit 6 n=1 Tax=Brassicogethes aeneus TaxID=1431903 RepID=A0A9P0FFH3_BRAAE|nr:unnamed protein product [Brassicogethes aeneus]
MALNQEEKIIQQNNEFDENSLFSSIEPLSKGLLNIYEPSLVVAQKQLKELTDKQELMLKQLHQENLSLLEVQHDQDLEHIFGRLKIYQAKLVNIKKDIKTLHDRSSKLKKRALKLQQIKEKEEAVKQQKELSLKQEEDLIGNK